MKRHDEAVVVVGAALATAWGWILLDRLAGAGSGREAVVGSTTCRVVSRTSDHQGGNEIVHERFVCETEMSDSRVTASLEGVFDTTFSSGVVLAAPWKGRVTLTNEDGTWRGIHREPSPSMSTGCRSTTG